MFEIFLVSWGRCVSLWTSLLELLLLHSIGFGKLCFHFHLSQDIFCFPIWFNHLPIGFLVACCLISTCLFCSRFSSCSWFLVLYHCGQKKMLDITSILFNLLKLFLRPSTWSRTFHVHLKRMCILLFWDETSYRYRLSPTGLMCNSRPLFLYWFSVCLDNMSLDVSVVLKFSTIVVLLSVSPFMFVNICFIYLDASILDTYMLLSVISSYWSLHHYIMPFFVFCYRLFFFWFFFDVDHS